MTTQLTRSVTRRGILKALGLGAATLALEPILEPVAKKMWFVPSTAPVGLRIESVSGYVLADEMREKKRQLYAKLEAADDLLSAYADDLEIAGPGVWRIESTEPMLDGNVRLLVRTQQVEPTVDVVDLNEGSEWSFENGTRVRFGKGSRAARDDDYWFTAGLGSKWPTAMVELEGSYKPTTASIIHKGPGRRG